MLTYIKTTSKGSSYVEMTTETLLQHLKSRAMEELLQPYRTHIGEICDPFLPRICFAALLRKVRRQVQVAAYNALLLLEVDNLASLEEAQEVKANACRIPFTRLCFIGASCRSVKIVCAFVLPGKDAALTEEDMRRYQTKAFKLLHYHYSSQLGLTVDYLEPTLERSCLISSDREAYYNPRSEPFYLTEDEVQVPEYRNDGQPTRSTRLPGYTDIQTQYGIYEWCLARALATAHEESQDEEQKLLLALTFLADYCHESGLPIDFGVRLTTCKNRFRSLPKALIEQTFGNAYERKITETVPFGCIPKSALQTHRTEAFLWAHYELRRNVMTGVVQYRPRDGFSFLWRDLDQSVMDTMTIRALRAGLDSWDKDMRRIVNSSEIPVYEPLMEYVDSLPAWDGRDRLAAFTARIPSTNPRTAYFMAVWLRSMVAHWLGKDGRHGNSLVPLLIGGQGTGKTSLANIILPPQLRDYYHDKVNFRNDTDLHLGLTSFALINIDEFDALKKAQQPTLKYLLTKHDVKLRPPYGKAFVQRPRFASFIATTNCLRPLVDSTGSRRFICIRIPDDQYVDFQTPVDYDQLYAQLLREVYDGCRYWLSNEETQELMAHNRQFETISDFSSMIDVLYRRPDHKEEGVLLTLDTIVNELAERFPNFVKTNAANLQIGRLLSAKGYEKAHKRRGNVYRVVRI